MNDAVERAYRDQGDRLYYALLAYTGDPEVAREAVAEAFSRALASTTIRDIVPWVWRVAFRVASQEQKHQRRTVEVPELGEETGPEPQDLLVALAKLSDRQRASIVLHYYAGYSLDEIAAILGTRKGTIGVHLHRARARLADLLEVDHA